MGFHHLGCLISNTNFSVLPPTRPGLNSIFTRRIRKLSSFCICFKKELIRFLRFPFEQVPVTQIIANGFAVNLKFLRSANGDNCGINTRDNHQARNRPSTFNPVSKHGKFPS